MWEKLKKTHTPWKFVAGFVLFGLGIFAGYWSFGVPGDQLVACGLVGCGAGATIFFLAIKPNWWNNL